MIKVPVYLLDATVISLCLSVFDWATFHTKNGAVKIHILLDYEGKLPIYLDITEGNLGDNKGNYDIPLEKGSVIVADRYYNDFPMLAFGTVKERELPANTTQHVLIDEEIELTNPQSKTKYPGRLRRVAVWDEQNQQTIELITNNFDWAAQTIGDLYKSRREIEVFFRDIKQLLHIKTLIGTPKNAVMIQIWTALITILLLKVMKATAKFGWHLSNLIAFIRLNIFVKIELQKWLDSPFVKRENPPQNTIQGNLPEFFFWRWTARVPAFMDRFQFQNLVRSGPHLLIKCLNQENLTLCSINSITQ